MATRRTAAEHSGIPVATARQTSTNNRRATYGFPPATRTRPNATQVLPVELGLRQGHAQTRGSTQATTTISRIPAPSNAPVANRRSSSAPFQPDQTQTGEPSRGTRAISNSRPAPNTIQREEPVEPVPARTQIRERSRTSTALHPPASTVPLVDRIPRASGRPTALPEARVFDRDQTGMLDAPLSPPATETNPERYQWDPDLLDWSLIHFVPPSDPAIDILTDEQKIYFLEKRTLPYTYDYSNKFEDCPICLDLIIPSEIVRRFPCMHLFHKTCVDTWILSGQPLSFRCPVCRVLVVQYVPPPSRYTVEERLLRFSS